MNAISTGGLARERQATGTTPALRLHGHPLEHNMAQAVTAHWPSRSMTGSCARAARPAEQTATEPANADFRGGQHA